MRTGPMRRARWRLRRKGRRQLVIRRGRVAFDLDGVAKGWMADRALRLLDGYPAAFVDADGDVAIRDSIGIGWQVGIEDPIRPGHDVAMVSTLPARGRGSIGIATSGTTKHRWGADDAKRHHLIDPSTGRPSTSPIVQATVVASSAAEAEALAKVAVIRSPERALLWSIIRREPRSSSPETAHCW